MSTRHFKLAAATAGNPQDTRKFGGC